MKLINGKLAFDITNHDSSKTTPAQSVLSRFQDDVKAYADSANDIGVPKMKHLNDAIIQAYFNGNEGADQLLSEALVSIQELKTSLEKIRESDGKMVRNTIPLLHQAVNLVDMSQGNELVKNSKTRFLLNRFAKQNSFIWIELLFGSLLSTKGEADLLRLNPYIDAETLTSVFHLVSVVMLRANRLGHTNRAIGIVIGLESLLKKILKVPVENRALEGRTLIPKLIQVSEDLSKTIVMGRYYITFKETSLSFIFDPRYLVFEFVWNIQLINLVS
jgi:hypothetical protein